MTAEDPTVPFGPDGVPVRAIHVMWKHGTGKPPVTAYTEFAALERRERH